MEALFSAKYAANMITYIYELPSWPHFTWDHAALAQMLAAVRNRQGRLTGRLEEFGFRLKARPISRH